MQTTQNKTAELFSLAIASVGFLVLLGWQFDIEFLKRPIPGLVAMNPVTAIGFIISGLAIFFILKSKGNKNLFYWLSIVAALLTVSIGVLKLSDFIFKTRIGEEEWLFNHKLFNEKSSGFSSSIAPATALNFIVLGLSIILSTSKKISLKSISNYLSLLSILVALFSMLGYIYFVPEFFEVLNIHPMAVQTAVCFLIAALVILFNNRNISFMKDFTHSDDSWFVTRFFMSVTFSIGIILGFILLFLHYRFSVSSEFIIALGVLSIIVSSFFITWNISIKLNKINKLREGVEIELLKVNRELQSSHNRFFKFFKSSPVPTNIIRIRDGRYIHVNHAFLKLFSLTREQVIGKTSAEFNIVDTKKREDLLEHVKQKNYNMQDVEISLRSANGKRIDILTSTQTIEIDGEPHMLNTLVDITERKAIEEELYQSKKNLNDAQKLSKTGSWEFNLKTGELFWSDELYNIFEIQQTSPEKLFNICREKIHPDDISNLDNAIKLANDAGIAAVYEHRIILKDGSIKHLLGLGEIIKNEEGEPLWIKGTTQDITERKEFEISLEKTRNSLSIAQEIAKLGSWDWDINTGKEFWSDEQYRIFGYNPGEVEASYSLFLNSLHPDDKNNVLMAIELALKGIYKFETEYRIITKKGEIKYIEVRAEVEKDENGRPIFMRGIVLDISEKKLNAQKLREYYNLLEIKNKELEQFAFIASHDLQEPLRTISSFTELLTEEYAAKFDANANTYVRFISQSAIRMRDLITGLLEYSRLGNKIVLEQTDCNEILKHAKENLQISIQESGAIIKAENLPVLKAYPVELELLFQNLIGNGIKFSKKKVAPEINIKAIKQDNQWLFSFADKGIGIEERHFEKIFLLFQRLHSRDNYKGSGIGLSHCKKIVELHNGKIWVESKAGEGSVFYFTIPEPVN